MRSRLISVCVFSCLPPIFACGQDFPAPNMARPAVPTVASMQTGVIDQVNLLAGNPVVTIPLYSVPEPGTLKLSFSMRANNNDMNQFTSYCVPVSPYPQCYAGYTVVPNVGYPQIYGNTYEKGILPTWDQGMGGWITTTTDPPTSMELVLDAAGTQHQTAIDTSSTYPVVSRALDGSGYMYTYWSNATPQAATFTPTPTGSRKASLRLLPQSPPNSH